MIGLAFLSALLGLSVLLFSVPVWMRQVGKAFRTGESWLPLHLLLASATVALGLTLIGVVAWLAVAF
jgi:hypothetical protein